MYSVHFCPKCYEPLDYYRDEEPTGWWCPNCGDIWDSTQEVAQTLQAFDSLFTLSGDKRKHD